MRNFIILLSFCLILSGCGKKNNHTKTSQENQVQKIQLSNHKDLKIISKSVSCQEIIIEKMSGDILLMDTEEEFDNVNSKMNDIIKKGKKDTKFEVSANDKKMVKSMGVNTSVVLNEESLKFTKQLEYDNEKLYLTIQSDLYKNNAPTFQTTQVYKVDDKCDLSLETQTVISFEQLVGVTKAITYTHVPKSNDVERVELANVIIPEYWDIDLIDMREILKDSFKKKITDFSESSNDGIETIEMEKQVQDKKFIFDLINKKEAWFDVDLIKIIVAGFQCDLKTNFSEHSSYVLIEVGCLIPEYLHYLNINEWKINRIEVFKNDKTREVIGFDDNEKSPIKFIITSDHKVGDIPNFNQYFSSITTTQISESNKYQYILQTKDMLDLSDIAHWDDQVLPGDEQYLKETTYLNVSDPEVKKIAEKIRKQKPKTRFEAIEMILTEVSVLLKYDYDMLDNAINRNLTTRDILKRKKGVCHHFANLATTLARALSIPAKNIRGFHITKSGIQPHAWIEVKLSNDRWTPLEPQADKIDHLSPIYFPTSEMTDYEGKSEDYKSLINEMLFYQNIKVEKL